MVQIIKTYASTVSVVIVICILSIVISVIAFKSKIAGYSELDFYESFSMSLSANIHINMHDLVFTVLIFGVLGAIIDMAISISTAVTEFYHNNIDLSFIQLVKSGKIVGKDILGTSVNTLFFAGLGEIMMQTNTVYEKRLYF